MSNLTGTLNNQTFFINTDCVIKTFDKQDEDVGHMLIQNVG
jgi:hypothetical protein